MDARPLRLVPSSAEYVAIEEIETTSDEEYNLSGLEIEIPLFFVSEMAALHRKPFFQATSGDRQVAKAVTSSNVPTEVMAEDRQVEKMIETPSGPSQVIVVRYFFPCLVLSFVLICFISFMKCPTGIPHQGSE